MCCLGPFRFIKTIARGLLTNVINMAAAWVTASEMEIVGTDQLFPLSRPSIHSHFNSAVHHYLKSTWDQIQFTTWNEAWHICRWLSTHTLTWLWEGPWNSYLSSCNHQISFATVLHWPAQKYCRSHLDEYQFKTCITTWHWYHSLLSKVVKVAKVLPLCVPIVILVAKKNWCSTNITKKTKKTEV